MGDEDEPRTSDYAILLAIIMATVAATFAVAVVWPSPGHSWPRHFAWLEFFGYRRVASWTVIFTGIGLAWLLLPRLRK